MARNKEKYNSYMKTYMLNRYYSRRKIILDKYNNKCCNCGCTINLQIDHIEYHNKSFNISKLWSINNKKFFIELEKCQILCEPCHLDKTKNEGSLLDKKINMICNCGKEFKTIKSYAGHKAWCKI